jgi:hypothetical protein
VESNLCNSSLTDPPMCVNLAKPFTFYIANSYLVECYYLTAAPAKMEVIPLDMVYISPSSYFSSLIFFPSSPAKEKTPSIDH